MHRHMKHKIIFLLNVVIISNSMAQEPLTEPQLLGGWQVSDSRLDETYIFKGNHEFQISNVQAQKDGKPITPKTTTRDGAYTFGANACSIGQSQGNLFIAHQSLRCCYKIYKMGPTLIFDNVDTGPVKICENKTLRKKVN